MVEKIQDHSPMHAVIATYVSFYQARCRSAIRSIEGHKHRATIGSIDECIHYVTHNANVVHELYRLPAFGTLRQELGRYGTALHNSTRNYTHMLLELIEKLEEEKESVEDMDIAIANALRIAELKAAANLLSEVATFETVNAWIDTLEDFA